MKKKDPTLNETQLGNLLLRYQKHLKPPQASVEKEFIKVVFDVCGVTLQTQQVSYVVASKTLVLKAPSLLRSELMLQSRLLLKELAARLGDDVSPKTLL